MAFQIPAVLRLTAGTIGFPETAKIFIRSTPIFARYFQKYYPNTFVFSAPIENHLDYLDNDIPTIPNSEIPQIVEIPSNRTWPTLCKYIKPGFLSDTIIVNTTPRQSDNNITQMIREFQSNFEFLGPYTSYLSIFRLVYLHKANFNKQQYTTRHKNINEAELKIQDFMQNNKHQIVNGYQVIQHAHLNISTICPDHLMSCLFLVKREETKKHLDFHQTNRFSRPVERTRIQLQGDSMEDFSNMLKQAGTLMEQRQEEKEKENERLRELEDNQRFNKIRLKHENRNWRQNQRGKKFNTASFLEDPMPTPYRTFVDDHLF